MRTILTAFAAAMLFSGAPWAQQATDSVAPEGAGAGPAASATVSPDVAAAEAAKSAGRPVEARDWMVSVANPLAAEAGARVLRAGGTAADAMVAVQAVLGLVEPQSSGLGAVRSCFGATERPVKSPRSTGARPRRWRRRRACSRTKRASPCSSMMPWWADARWGCRERLR